MTHAQTDRFEEELIPPPPGVCSIIRVAEGNVKKIFLRVALGFQTGVSVYRLQSNRHDLGNAFVLHGDPVHGVGTLHGKPVVGDENNLRLTADRLHNLEK